MFLSICSTCEPLLIDKNHILCYPRSWVYWELPNIRDPLETLHMATPLATKVFFILLLHLPWGPQMVQVKMQPCSPPHPKRPQLPSLSIGNFHLWKTGCFKPWSALQMLKCHNKTLQVLDQHRGNLLLNHSRHVSFVQFYTRKRRFQRGTNQLTVGIILSHLILQFSIKANSAQKNQTNTLF